MEDAKNLSAYELIGVTEEAAKDIGARFKAKRENELHLTIAALSIKTKINQDYLENIESGKWDEIPTGSLGRNFIRLYARELNCPIPEFENKPENLQNSIHTRNNLEQMIALARSKGDVQTTQLRNKFNKLINIPTEIVRSVRFKQKDNQAPESTQKKTLFKSKFIWTSSIISLSAAAAVFMIINREDSENIDILSQDLIQSDVIALDGVEKSPLPATVESEITREPVVTASENFDFKPQETVIIPQTVTTPIVEATPVSNAVVSSSMQKMELDVLSPVGVRIEADGKQIVDGLTQPGKLNVEFEKRVVLVIQDSSQVKLTYAGWNNETLSPFARKRTIILNAKRFVEN